MTQKTFQMTAQGPKKMPGWFSWRHQTRDAHDRARREYQQAHGRDARKRRADERANAKPSFYDQEYRPNHDACHEHDDESWWFDFNEPCKHPEWHAS